jgi:hypothetical protein
MRHHLLDVSRCIWQRGINELAACRRNQDDFLFVETLSTGKNRVVEIFQAGQIIEIGNPIHSNS